MSRCAGLLTVGGFAAVIAGWTSLFIWPFWAGIGWVAAMFALLTHDALFLWPRRNRVKGGREPTP